MGIPNNDMVYLLKGIINQVRYAEEKHPDFAARFESSTTMLPAVQNALTVARAKSDAEAKDGYSFEATINEEILEALEAYLQGDLEHARQELRQCGAVIVRALWWLNNLKEIPNDSNKI